MSDKIDVVPEDIQALREWIYKTPHVPSHYDDNFLASFIIGCKGSIQKTKLVLEKFSSVVSRYPEYYESLDLFSKKMSSFMDIVLFYPLANKMDDDVTVFFCSITKNNHDPYDLDSSAYLPIEFASMLVRLKENEHGSGKMMVIIDGAQIKLAHVRHTTPMVLKTWLAVLDNLVPMRLNGIHAINLPTYMEWMLTLIKSLLKDKIAQRIHVHRSMEDVFNYIPKEIFPKDYGGCDVASQIGHDRWRQTMESYNGMLEKELDILRDLDKFRPKTKDEEEMIGTFKKLTVD